MPTGYKSLTCPACSRTIEVAARAAKFACPKCKATIRQDETVAGHYSEVPKEAGDGAAE
jgi:predicted RNA-binding Zn-ribbon protein involved in translation (DUF1610 family)